jgi:hypothetical protein
MMTWGDGKVNPRGFAIGPSRVNVYLFIRRLGEFTGFVRNKHLRGGNHDNRWPLLPRRAQHNPTDATRANVYLSFIGN